MGGRSTSKFVFNFREKTSLRKQEQNVDISSGGNTKAPIIFKIISIVQKF